MTVLIILVLAGSLAGFFMTNLTRRYRYIQLIANVLVTGFLFGNLLAMERFYVWMGWGMSLSIVSAIFAVTVILGLATCKNWYCAFVCPYGAAQELAGKLIRKKPCVPAIAHRILIALRRLFLLTVAGLMVLAAPVDYIYFEPFAAFQFRSAPPAVLALAALFLLISLAIPRFWCTYLCPTGQILELFQKPLMRKKNAMKKECAS